MTQRTLVILKPDTIVRGISGKITDKFETRWLKLVWCKMEILWDDLIKDHYSHLLTKSFFGEIVDYMTSAPVILQVWEWPDAVEIVRRTVGSTNPTEALPGTIRWDFAVYVGKNVVHASEDLSAAEIEVERFFKPHELFSHKRADEHVTFGR